MSAPSLLLMRRRRSTTSSPWRTACMQQLEERPATAADPAVGEALQLLRRGVEASLRKHTSGGILLSNWTEQTSAEARKRQIEDICKDLRLRPRDIQTQMRNDKITPYTSVSFESSTNAQKFIGEWVKKKVRNAAGAPVYARPDIDKAVRQLRKPLIDVEKRVKKLHKEKGEKHEYRMNFDAGAFYVDKVMVAELTPTMQIHWLDETLRAALHG